MQRVAIYCRLSDEDRDKRTESDESESIQNQKSMLVHYCMEQGWEIYRIYCDEDYSGADRSRPEWQRMIDDCENRRIDIVLCKTQSRFSRDMEMVEKYIHGKFAEWQVRFVGLVDHADTEIGGNKKSRQINGLVNEWYLEDLSDNIRRTLTHKKQNGQWTGSFAPFGYEIDPDNKSHLVIDPVAAEVVRDVFSLFASGFGYISIAKTLNDRGIPCPTQYKRQHGSRYRTNECRVTSQVWTDSTIAYLLRQETYCGTLVQGKSHNLSYKSKKRLQTPKKEWIRCFDIHEAIIEPHLWEAVQGRLRIRSRASADASGDRVDTRHALSGKVFCAECKNAMYKLSSKGASGRYSYLKCKTTKNAKNVCGNTKFLRLDLLEEAVLSEINLLLERYYHLESLSSESTNSARTTALLAEREALLRQAERKRAHRARLYEDLLDGKLSEELFSDIGTRFGCELQAVEKRLQILEQEKYSLEQKEKESPRGGGAICSFHRAGALTHELVNAFIERIEIDSRDEQSRRKIIIYWLF